MPSSRYLPLVLLTTVACSSPDPTSSTPPPTNEVDAGYEDGGQSLPLDSGSGDAGDAQEQSRVLELTVDGQTLAIDGSSIRAGTLSDFNGTVWVTLIDAKIVGGENLPWNVNKRPLELSIYAEQPRSAPFPLGDFSCVRGDGFMKAKINAVESEGPMPLLELAPEADCKTHFDDWKQTYKGSMAGKFRTPSAKVTLPFSIRWSIRKG